MVYNLEDLFQSINDIFEQYDSGKLPLKDANEIAARCCKEFLKLESGSDE